jgi:hypothetical protein
MARITNDPDGWHRTLNVRRGATRRTSEAFVKSKRVIDKQESFGEASLYRALDVNRTVLSFLPQPEPRTYEYEGILRKAYSDVKIWFVDGTVAIREVKPARARSDVALQARFTAIKESYATIGLGFALLYGDDLFRTPRRHNVDLLLRARESPPSDCQTQMAVEQIRRMGAVPIGEIRVATGMSRFEALWLVAVGHASIDLDCEITSTSLLMP